MDTEEEADKLAREVRCIFDLDQCCQMVFVKMREKIVKMREKMSQPKMS